jgi:hypothetical protein
MKRVLLDACVPHWVRHRLGVFETSTAQFAKLDHLSNGDLLAAINGRFDVLVTLDRNMTYQHQMLRYDVAIVVLRPNSQNRLGFEPLLKELATTIASATTRTVYVMGSGPIREGEL